MILPLIQLQKSRFYDPSVQLRQPAAAVEDFGPTFQQQLVDLIDTFRSHKIAVGLAAPQIGVGFRFSIVNISKNKAGPDLVLVNPTILESSRRVESRPESCMSIPGVKGQVERPIKVSIAYQDENGKTRTLKAEGFLARVICHEVDHLDGKLYLDRMAEGSILEETDIFKDD